MLNHIWAFLVVVGILVGASSAVYRASTGEVEKKVVDGKEVTVVVPYDTWDKKLQALATAGNKLTNDIVNSVAFRYDDNGKQKSGAVGIAMDYIGIMALWLGIMKIAEVSGLIQKLAQLIRPVFRFVFPTVPVDHPAAGAILMNFAANMLGLDNAATPLGVKAMKELQELNGKKDTASNAMCMFLAINVSCLTLLPVSIIGYRVAAHSKAPTQFMVPMLIATFIGHIVAFLGCRLAEKFSPDTPPPSAEDKQTAEASL